jgi:hypothetical protein
MRLNFSFADSHPLKEQERTPLRAVGKCLSRRKTTLSRDQRSGVTNVCLQIIKSMNALGAEVKPKQQFGNREGV